MTSSKTRVARALLEKGEIMSIQDIIELIVLILVIRELKKLLDDNNPNNGSH